MRNWHSFYEILKFPLEIIFFAVIIAGTGNLITNPAFGIADFINNDYIILLAEILQRTGQFLLVNFPLLFLIRLVARRGGSATTFISAITGYVGFLVATMFVADTSLPSTAFSSILGISINKSTLQHLSGSTHYPLQTGVFGAIIVAMITLWAFNRSRNRSEYGFLSFISKEVSVSMRTVSYSLIAGAVTAYVWPFVFMGIQKIISFITVDTTNPINLTLYGICDRLFGALGLGTLIRQPFWYTVNGGTWVNMAGASISGDVNIWTSQVTANAVTGYSGRFFTPYYILNIFAVPGMIWAMFSLYTDAMERRRMWVLCLIATIVSLLCGTLLPLELMLALLCPLLLMFHLMYTGVMFGIMHVMHAYLGYYSTDTTTIMAFPGTLPELIKYLQYPSMRQTIIIVAAAGAISFVIYFLVTRLYFRRLAVDLFDTGTKERMVRETIKAVGGIENVKMTQSSISALTISVYDPNKMNIDRLRKIGTYRVFETRVGYTICFGAASTMIRIGINDAMRESIRTVNKK